MSEPKGIKWSAPVLIRQSGVELTVTVPPQVVKALGAAAGDVLNFTELPEGSIEVWLVKKGHYSSLADMSDKKATKPPAKARQSAKKKAKR